MAELDLIEFLQKTTDLEVSCPKCGSSFSPRQAKLFDIRAPYPQNVIRAFKKKEGQLASALKGLDRKKQKLEGKIELLREKEKMLKHRKKERPKRIETITRSINIGQIIEKIVPASKKFRYNVADCRSMFDPIDYIAFNGYCAKGAVDSISFIEVKTGDASLQKVQKKIKEAVEGGNLKIRTY